MSEESLGEVIVYQSPDGFTRVDGNLEMFSQPYLSLACFPMIGIEGESEWKSIYA